MIKTGYISANSHIDNLKNQLALTNTSQLDYLILAHPDQSMISQLQKVYQAQNVAIIGMAQNYWQMDSESMSELVQWVLSETSAKGILLVGHSQGGTPAETVQVCTSGQISLANHQPSNRISSFMDRVKNVQSCCKKNEEHFVAELNSLKDQVSVQGGRVTNPELVQGLFYRAESGLFCAYDPEACQFEALMVNPSIG
jgi:predicted esterase YcpF (UPF0227 family)